MKVESARLTFGHQVALALSRISPSYRTVVVPVPPEDFVHDVVVELVSSGWLVSWVRTPDDESAILIRLPNNPHASEVAGGL